PRPDHQPRYDQQARQSVRGVSEQPRFEDQGRGQQQGYGEKPFHDSRLPLVPTLLVGTHASTLCVAATRDNELRRTTISADSVAATGSAAERSRGYGRAGLPESVCMPARLRDRDQAHSQESPRMNATPPAKSTRRATTLKF